MNICPKDRSGGRRMRKIVQILSLKESLFALCDDGSLWIAISFGKWEKYPTPFTEEPAPSDKGVDPCENCESSCKDCSKKQAYDQSKG